MNKNLINEILKGSFWSVFGQLLILIVSFGTNIILARILSPNEFGQVGIVLFFITIMTIITESGMGGALVRNKNSTRIDYSTAFITNLAISILLFTIMAVFSRHISNYYHDILLRDLLIVSSIIILINATQVSHNALLISNLKFRELYFYKFISNLLASIIGVVLALNGFGVWSIVTLQIANALFYTILLWCFEGAFLKFQFSKKSFKKMGSYGINTTLSSILTSVFDNIYQLILAKYFSIFQTGNYYQAKRFQDVPGGVLNVLAQGVVFSSLAKLQDDKAEFIKLYNLVSKYFLIVLGMISLIVFIYADAIIFLTFGAKWMDSVYFMKILTVASFFYMQENFNKIIFKVYDKTKFILVLDIAKKIIQSISILIGIIIRSIDFLIIGFTITSAIGYFANFYVSRRVLGKVDLHELVTLLKIVLSCVIIAIFSDYMLKQLASSYLQKISTIPITLFLFIVFLFVLNVMRIKDLLKLKMIK